MSNKTNHRRGTGKRNRWKPELPPAHGGCSGEGHNGQIGRSKWKKLSRRNERRALAQERVPRIKKYPTSHGSPKPRIMDSGEY